MKIIYISIKNHEEKDALTHWRHIGRVGDILSVSKGSVRVRYPFGMVSLSLASGDIDKMSAKRRER